LNIADFFTFSRILVTPFVIYFIFVHNFFIASILFIYCSISDLLDGYFARKYDLVNERGNFLDPLADKILMIGVLTVLLYQGSILWWAYSIIIGRDILITFYRQYLRNKNQPLVTSKYGKFKTVFQHLAVIFILVADPSKELIDLVMGLNAIYAGATGIHYMVKNGF
tara:strand:+ start:878 stop:1378 length:501 start_codon:yes stop_codon:yes gene_type:complete